MPIPSAIDLSGKRVVITGAGGGIGRATAHACAALGAELVLTDVVEFDDLTENLRADGVTLSSRQLDIADRGAVEALAESCGAVDAAVALAGICPLEADWLESDDWDDVFHRVMDVNVLGCLNVARAWLPRMATAGGGRIVLVGSIGGRMGGISPIVQPHYVASKGGVHALVYWLARRAAPKGVLVNGVAPGPVATDMTETTPYDPDKYPLGRIGRPDEIAWPIAFLCAPAASYLSGAILDVNGGLFVN